MNKLLTLVLVAIIGVEFTGCGDKLLGEDEVNAARDEYASLSSAHLIIRDMNSKITLQDFSFVYNEIILTYCYIKADRNNIYMEYNDGQKMYIKENGVKMTYEGKDMTKYTRKNTHQNASKQIFFFIPKYVDKSEKIDNADDTVTYRYTYDVNKLKMDSENGEVTGFVTNYVFNKDGNFLYLDEESKILKDRNEQTWVYRVSYYDADAITEITNPFD